MREKAAVLAKDRTYARHFSEIGSLTRFAVFKEQGLTSRCIVIREIPTMQQNKGGTMQRFLSYRSPVSEYNENIKQGNRNRMRDVPFTLFCVLAAIKLNKANLKRWLLVN